MSIKLFLVKRFPKIFLPWHQLGILTEAHKYREAHLLIEKVEKDNPDLKEFLGKDEAWKLIKKTCWDGIFVMEYYVEATKLLTDKKYEEAKKLAIEGCLNLRAWAFSFGVSEERIVEVEKEFEKRFPLSQGTLGELDEFGKEYIAKIKSADEKSFMDTYINLAIIIPTACNAHISKAGH